MGWVQAALYALYLAVAAPILVELAWDPGPGAGVLATLEGFLGPFCHHMLDRSLRLGGEPLVVCARCTGLYAGWILATLLVWFTLPAPVERPAHARWTVRIRRVPPASAAAMAWLMFALAVVAASVESLDLVRTSNLQRLLLGLPLGAAPGWSLLFAAALLTPHRDAAATALLHPSPPGTRT